LTIFLDDRRRRLAQLLSKLQHVCAGFPLLFIGVNRLVTDESDRPIAVLEVAIATAVLVAFAQELRAEWRHSAKDPETAPHPEVGWFDLAAGFLLIFEAFHGAHTKPGYLRPPFLAGLVAIALGLFHRRLQNFAHHRRYITIDDIGVELRSSPLRRLKIRWADLASIDLSEAKIVFHRTNGRRRSIRLSWYGNADAVRRAVADHPASAALQVAPAPHLNP
jgi:hypothetical protein